MARILLPALLALLPVLPAPVPAQVPAQVPPQVRVEAGSAAVGDAVLANVERLTDRGIRRLKGRFPGTPNRPIRVIVHQTTDSMPAQIRQHLSFRSPGLALLARDEIHIVLDHLKYNPPGDLRTVVEHEVVHVLLDQHVGKGAGPYVPRWFHEGLAQALAESLDLGIREEDILWRVQQQTYLSFARLVDAFPRDDHDALRLAYGQSFSYVSFLLREVGLSTLLQIARNCGPSGDEQPRDFEETFLAITEKALVIYEEAWRNYVLHESGAKYRYILGNCFLLSLAAALPLLAFALVRRLRRDEGYRNKLIQEDHREDDREDDESDGGGAAEQEQP